MVQPVTPPDSLSLIPSLLAFLPTSFASSRPPPALLPFLSPILRQRVHIHTSASADAHDNWLRLLCWDNAKAERLKDVVENANFEPHPASGEVEVGDIDTLTYKRADLETLKVHIPLSDWDLSAIYLWCVGGDDGDGWKLAELLPFDSDLSRQHNWYRSIPEAEENFKQQNPAQTLQVSQSASLRKPSVSGEDDDDYWAMYDNTPSRTPARKHSTNPTGAGIPEEDYYAQYNDVQPAMDNHDPDEVHEELEEPRLNRNALQQMLAQNSIPTQPTGSSATHTFFHDQAIEHEESSVPVRQPTPSSPRSRASSDTVERLETEAEKYATSEIGIRHHISYSVKSMYRLAKSAGIGRSEFEDMVQRELDTLSILDQDD